jgi:hypothetical protein
MNPALVTRSSAAALIARATPKSATTAWPQVVVVHAA